MNELPISEDDLHAYADRRLAAARRDEVEAWLVARPDMQARVADWQAQNALLREAFDGVLGEPLPSRLVEATRVRKAPLRLAAVVAWLALGTVVGFVARGYVPSGGPPPAVASLPRQAALAHAVYSPEVRHPVEVAADQEAHLVAWLSKRLGTGLKAPRLGAVGFELVGGRLLPGEGGPVAQFMYQDARGQRLTLYVRSGQQGPAETAFRYAQEGPIGVFYWVDGTLGYALSGQIDKPDLLAVANAVYRQINP